jgi:hypothetical protein
MAWCKYESQREQRAILFTNGLIKVPRFGLNSGSPNGFNIWVVPAITSIAPKHKRVSVEQSRPCLQTKKHTKTQSRIEPTTPSGPSMHVYITIGTGMYTTGSTITNKTNIVPGNASFALAASTDFNKKRAVCKLRTT